jgi:hypothetical protein
MHPVPLSPAPESAPEESPFNAQQPQRDATGPVIYVDALCPRCDQRGLRLPRSDGSSGPVCPHCGSPVPMSDS